MIPLNALLGFYVTQPDTADSAVLPISVRWLLLLLNTRLASTASLLWHARFQNGLSEK